ncbi:ribosomal protein L17 [Candidatus Amoebophilus asiaticus 5a2]|uniref:Large ribosomal subunit protein bL17 n=1 Tax=Amoebophilus asiaticus (strain 5a2) TaxID=452471 RepID=RL17_AMOA5|nr:50S ribosomal protein L17 [Candidatus Amoebophilus asiaticus]B3EUJ5.1 RecName: Full=Large ribosomal subunit protein bL17; AltName: Full=50S ribosomal protein L17 [Candidatus Amoebophilus asiaticus 5a2]ACE05614.1 ribosomal protein L17 [Candidatus Amoebophilus asiaticus 5a2]
MRHGKKFNHLSRPASHRKALLSNQAKSLILHKRIITTVAKAKALRKFVEPIITKAKQDSTHARRVVFSYFQDKEPVKLLFNEVAPKIGDRPGGYTRIIRLGNRLGDNAEMCMMELVDYNTYLQKAAEPKQTKARTRRGKGKLGATTTVSSEKTQPNTQDMATQAKPVENTQVEGADEQEALDTQSPEQTNKQEE